MSISRNNAFASLIILLAASAAPACTGVKEHYPVVPMATATGGSAAGRGGSTGSGGQAGSPVTGSGGRTGQPSGGSGGAPASSGSGGGSPAGSSGGAMGGTPSGSGGAPPAGPDAGDPPSPPSPPSGEGIEIDGKRIPKDEAVVLIYIGTSNLAGRAQEPNDLKDYFLWYGRSLPGGLPDPMYDPKPLPVDPRLWMFSLDQKFVPAREPSASDHSVDQGAGPGMGIMRAAAAKWPGVTFISIGRGQSGERGGYCAHFLEKNLITGQPWSTVPPANNMDQAANRAYGFYNEVIEKRAKPLKGKVTFGAIITMFGATEERPGAPVPSPPAEPFLSQCLAGIAKTYRDALEDQEIPVIFGDFDHGALDYTYDGVLGQKVRRQIRLAQSMTPKSDIIPTDGIDMRDEHHFTMKGHKQWADRAIDIIDKQGWARWKAKQ